MLERIVRGRFKNQPIRKQPERMTRHEKEQQLRTYAMLFCGVAELLEVKLRSARTREGDVMRSHPEEVEALKYLRALQ
jgi:hypothetical protein